MKNKKLSLLILFICLFCMCILGCDKNKTSPSGNNINIAMTVDGISVTLAEARYYAYNKQASYEVYYFASGTDINWNEPYYNDSDITLEQLVKTEVMEQIDKDIVISEYAKRDGITLSDKDISIINSMADEFLSSSKQKLLDKTDVSKDVLITIYTRQMYCRKMYEKMGIVDDTDAQYKLYEEISADTNFNINNELWENITFDEAIYSADDVDVME